MRILGIDTATPIASVALVEDGILSPRSCMIGAEQRSKLRLSS